MMDLECPNCHKHRFRVMNFITSKTGSNDIPVSCPHCGAIFTLDSKSATTVNIITMVVFLGYLALAIPLTPNSPLLVVSMAVGGVVAMTVARRFALIRFGKIAPYVVKHREPYPRIGLGQVAGELERLKRPGDFFVLFTPDEEAYLSFIKKKSGIVADLAFAIGKFEELEPKFREAVGRAGAIAHPYKKRGMHGIEAALGTDNQTAALKTQTIMQGTFGLQANAEVPVMRE